MAPKRRAKPQVPEVLAALEDRSNREKRGGSELPCHSDVLSVYLQGGPRYRLGRRTYAFKPPVGILIGEGTVDSDLQEGPVRGSFVLFRGGGLVTGSAGPARDKVMVSLGADRIVVPQLKAMRPADAERLVGLIRGIREIGKSGLAGRLSRVSLLMQAVALYCEAPAAGGEAPTHRAADTLCRLIVKSAFENIPMARIYDRVELSAAHAATLFRAAFGSTPVAYRRRVRMRRARELLISSQLNVSEVAYAVGFTDPLYFSRTFRRAFGVTPSSLIQEFDGRRRQASQL